MIKGFTAENWKLKLLNHPLEDSYSINNGGKIIAVADGVTRDPMEYLQNGLLGKLNFALNYPKISPAKIASDIFCEIFPSVLKDFDVKDERAILESFNEANKKIRSWNSQNIPNTDYLMNDFAGCVASGISEQNGAVSWGYLTDCGIAIFDKNGNLRFKTEDESPHRLDEYFWQDKQIKGKSWNQPEVRKRIRSHYRNNPDEKHSFGVLTGEENAMDYVRTGSWEINPGEFLLVYTDGLEPIIFSENFSNKLKQNDFEGLEKLCKQKVKTEGTLVLRKF